MISYELAKELRDEGFPQKKWSGITAFDGLGNTEEHGAYCPTLDQLIEACGDNFSALVLERDGGWSCSAFDRPGIYGGSTPEEAVARLYLELNKS